MSANCVETNKYKESYRNERLRLRSRLKLSCTQDVTTFNVLSGTRVKLGVTSGCNNIQVTSIHVGFLVYDHNWVKCLLSRPYVSTSL